MSLVSTIGIAGVLGVDAGRLHHVAPHCTEDGSLVAPMSRDPWPGKNVDRKGGRRLRIDHRAVRSEVAGLVATGGELADTTKSPPWPLRSASLCHEASLLKTSGPFSRGGAAVSRCGGTTLRGGR